MTINSSGVLRRGDDDEKADLEQRARNVEAESWINWPNEAGFEGLDEHRGPIDLTVVGHIPGWAAGTLFRTGPGQFSIDTNSRGRFDVSHWFDGFAHCHKFEIIAVESDAPGPTAVRVRYSSRRQSETFVEGIRRRGWQSSVTFAQRSDPCIGIFAKMQSIFRSAPSLNNCVAIDRNVNITGGRKVSADMKGLCGGTQSLYITTDANVLQEVDPDTLEPLRYTYQAAFNPQLKGPLSAAHSQRDPETGELFNFNLEIGLLPIYRVYRTDPLTGEAVILATIRDAAGAYIHSMFLTQNYVVLCIPVSHYAWSGIKIPFAGNIVEALAPFDSAKEMQWIVIDRRGPRGVVARFTSPAGFFFHTINAFEDVKVKEEEEEVELNFDLVMYDNIDIIKAFYMDVILDRHGATKRYWLDSHEGGRGQRLVRFRYSMPSSKGDVTVNLDTAEEISSIPGPHHGELPTINPRYLTRRHRFVYGAASRGLSTVFDCLVKTDTATREALIWAPSRGHTPGEPVFVPRPSSEGEGHVQRDEDDGVILSVVLDGYSRKSYLVCIDAKSMEETGRAECQFPIALGLHGCYAPGY